VEAAVAEEALLAERSPQLFLLLLAWEYAAAEFR
jgi:hypothetical protein